MHLPNVRERHCVRKAANLAVLLLCCAAAPSAQLVPRPLLVLHGNVLFDDVVYRSILDLPQGATATDAAAAAVSAKLRGFLRRAGYDLATVKATVAGDQIAVEIDEGRLDKLIVIGEGLAETFRFRSELSMPSGVFNRPILERQLRALAERYKLRHYAWKLVPAEVQDNHGPQIEELESLLGLPGIQPGLRYELHIVVTSSPWARGFSPEVSIGAPEGLGGGGQYRDRDFLLPDDRWEVTGRIAAAMREHLDTPGSRPVFTRALLRGRWLSPAILTDSLRPALTVRGDLLSLQRADLHIESFHQATFAASFDAAVLQNFWSVAAGVGIERRFLYDLTLASGANPLIGETPPAQTRPYLEALAEVVFNSQELRSDRKHRLDFEGRFYTGSTSSKMATWLRLGWQRRFPIGWHEVIWRARGTLLFGEVLFPDEESLGGHLNGAFGGSDFVRKVGSTGLEFRYSLLRDLFKVGLFYDQAIFGLIDRTIPSQSSSQLGAAGAGGPAAHLLLADEIQIDFYLAFGWKTAHVFNFAPGLELRQVF